MIGRMRGVNFGGWFSQVDAIEEKDPEGFPGLEQHVATFLGTEDFARVKGWGFDHIRLPVDYFNVFRGEALVPDETILRHLDHAVDGMIAAGLRVIFDLHRCPGHDFHDGTNNAQAFFVDPDAREASKKVWTHLAERYGSRPEVLLEILNEPVAEDSAVWDRIKDEMAAHIRRHAPKSTIVVGSNRWNQPVEFANLTPLEDDNVLYSFHFYNPVIFTHQKAAWLKDPVFQESRPYPGEYLPPEGAASRLPLEFGRWNRDRMDRMMEQVFLFRQKYDAAVACNEFGVYVGGADRPSMMAWMEDFLSLLQQHDVGWSYWNYKNLDFGLLSRGEKLFADAPQYANPERVDHGLVELLQRY